MNAACDNFFTNLFGSVIGHHVKPKHETLAEHKEHCRAKPGNCPFERKAAASAEKEDAVKQTAPSEHAYRIDRDGTEIPSNADFAHKLAAYDRDHRIYAVSDLHSTNLDDLDLDGYGIVLIGGDISRQKSDKNGVHQGDPKDVEQWFRDTFKPFLEKHKDKQFVIIPGNHDRGIDQAKLDWPANAHFLIDQEANVNGLRIYGTPWCLHNMNGAFEVGHDEIKERFKAIPEGLDILIAHTPPKFAGSNIDFGAEHNGHFGSTELADAIREKKPKLVLCGHIHTGDHTPQQLGDTTVVNVSKIGTKREKGGFCGRAIGFSKGGDGTQPATFLMDATDGQQIDRSAYPEPNRKIRDVVRLRDGQIAWGSAHDIIRNMARASQEAVANGHFQPDPNALGLYDYARPLIERLPDGGYNTVLKDAVNNIEAARKAGWTKPVADIPDHWTYRGKTPTGYARYGLFGYAPRKQPDKGAFTREMDAFFAGF